MTKEEKNKEIETLAGQLADSAHFYLTDISKLDAVNTGKLRRMCFDKKVKMQVVKNSLLKKALEKSTERDYKDLMGAPLKGSTALFFTEAGSAPAKIIKEFRKKNEKPLLKAAFVEHAVYLGDAQLDVLAAIKSKNELIGDIISLLQTPARNIISALTNPERKFDGGGDVASNDNTASTVE